MATRDWPPRAVTFDCWCTLLYEEDPSVARGLRLKALGEIASRAGIDDDSRIEEAFVRSHLRHVELWQNGVASGSLDMARWALEELGIEGETEDEQAGLVQRFEEASLQQVVHPLTGAREALERLRESQIRTALVCDTGFSPGRVVRQVLDQHGLLSLLEVQIFSNEIGVPKPHGKTFRSALEPLDVPPERAVHVGDLRRTDVRGARSLGMGSVRIRTVNDDRSDHPEADAVVDSHSHLIDVLGVR